MADSLRSEPDPLKGETAVSVPNQNGHHEPPEQALLSATTLEHSNGHKVTSQFHGLDADASSAYTSSIIAADSALASFENDGHSLPTNGSEQANKYNTQQTASNHIHSKLQGEGLVSSATADDSTEVLRDFGAVPANSSAIEAKADVSDNHSEGFSGTVSASSAPANLCAGDGIPIKVDEEDAFRGSTAAWQEHPPNVSASAAGKEEDSFGQLDTTLLAPPASTVGTPGGDHVEGSEHYSAVSAASAIPALVSAGNDDGIGDFGSALPATALPTESVAALAGSNDDFGSFSTAPPTPAAVSVEVAPCNDDVLGEFDAASPAPAAPAPASTVAAADGDDGFGDFGDALSTAAAAAPPPSSTSAAADQAGDDFDAAYTTAASSSTLTVAANSDSGFGEFDTAQTGAAASFAAAAGTSVVAADDDEVDGFGDFDAAPPAAAPPRADTAVAQPAAASADDDGDDGFGDFGAAPSAAAPPTADTAMAQPAAAAADDVDDGFGDFDAAPPTAAPPPSNTAVAQPVAASADDDGDDGFGDFGAAAAPPPPPVDTAMAQPAAAAADDDSDDGFGDFGAAPSAVPPSSIPVAAAAAPSDDGDGFGDFGTAPPAAAAAPAGDDDDDDGFGDFDAAPAAAAAAASIAATAAAAQTLQPVAAAAPAPAPSTAGPSVEPIDLELHGDAFLRAVVDAWQSLGALHPGKLLQATSTYAEEPPLPEVPRDSLLYHNGLPLDAAGSRSSTAATVSCSAQLHWKGSESERRVLGMLGLAEAAARAAALEEAEEDDRRHRRTRAHNKFARTGRVPSGSDLLSLDRSDPISMSRSMLDMDVGGTTPPSQSPRAASGSSLDAAPQVPDTHALQDRLSIAASPPTTPSAAGVQVRGLTVRAVGLLAIA